MTILSSLIGQVEFSNPNPLTATDFQQGTLFQRQYGSGITGFNNYVNQAIAANPSLTLGDFYGQYNTNTGTPGFGANVSSLSAAAFNNLATKAAAAGLSLDTPIAALTENVPTNGTDSPLSFTCENCGTTGTGGSSDSISDILPGLGTDLGSNVDIFGDTSGALGGSSIANISGAPVTGDGAGGSATVASTGFFPALIDAASSGLMRIIMVIFGLVLIAAGAYVIANKDNPLSEIAA